MPNYDEDTNGLKFCNGCKEWRSKGDFNKDPKAPDKLHYRCRLCRRKYRRQQEVKDRTAAYNKKYARENPELMKAKDRKNSLKRFWNMTVEEFEALKKSQGGTCALCDKTESNPHKSLCIDHDHATGKIRGLLCDNHNRAMGLFKDSIEDMEKAIKYLRNHRSKG
jgi:Recombination endonuclease VII